MLGWLCAIILAIHDGVPEWLCTQCPLTLNGWQVRGRLLPGTGNPVVPADGSAFVSSPDFTDALHAQVARRLLLWERDLLPAALARNRP